MSDAPQKFRILPVVLALIAGLALGGAGVMLYMKHQSAGMPKTEAPLPAAAGKKAPEGVELAEPDADGRPVLYWYDPMKPDAHFPKPGPSPFMDMDLVPKYADEADAGDGGEAPSVAVSPAVEQSLGLRTTIAQEGELRKEARLAAEVVLNEHDYAVVQARSGGFVESVSPLAVGDPVKAGEVLAKLTIPGWTEAQTEYLVQRETHAPQGAIEGTLRRLKLLGMPQKDIDDLIRTRRVKTVFTIEAPISGVVTAISMRAGMNVNASQTVAEIEGIDPIWVVASIPEAYARDVSREGTKFSLTSDAFPGESWKVLSDALLPGADAATRTLRLRLQVANPKGTLRPGMTAVLHIDAPGERGILIPREAVIDDGRMARVIVKRDGRFYPTPVAIKDASGSTAAVAGVNAGDEIVLSSIYLIDSEASISGALERLKAPAEVDMGAMKAGDEHDRAH